MLDTQSRLASAGSLTRTGRQQVSGADLDQHRYGMPSQAPAYGPGDFKAWRTLNNNFDLGGATAFSGDAGRRVNAGSTSGVTDFAPEDTVFQQFVKDIFGQPVTAGSGSAQQAAAEASTGFQPAHFAAGSTDADAMMADNSPHHGHDTGSPGSETSQQETFPAQFLNVEDWAAHMLLDAPHQQLPLPPHHSVHPHPPSHQVPEHLNSPQEGLHAEESSTHALHPPPVQPDNFSTPASLSGNANPHKAPGIRDADCQHQELMQTPDAALDDGRDDDWYDMLQPLQDSDSESSHYSIGDDSPLSRLADSGCDHDMALDAALSSAATPPAHQDYSRKQALNAVEKLPEADVAPQHNSRYAEPAQEQVPPSPAVTYRQYVVTTMNRIVNGHNSRKRPMTTEEQVPEAVPPHNSRHVMTRPAASPTTVNQSHAVLPHPRQLQQHSIAGHFRTGVQHCEREPVQQAQADALSVARGEEPRRKRRKTAGIPFSAARITLPTALSTAAATQAASAHFPLPDEVSAAAASTAASTAAFTAAVAIQASVPAMTCAAEMHYQQGDVVWAKLGSDPYWPARVQKPSRQQHKDSKMGPGKVFVVYFGTNEISALPKNRIKSWNTHPAPRSAVGDLKAAILEARLAVRKI